MYVGQNLVSFLHGLVSSSFCRYNMHDSVVIASCWACVYKYVKIRIVFRLCTDHSSSVALWLTRRFGLNDGPCLNLLRSDRVLIPFALWLLVGTPSAFGPEFAYRLRAVLLAYFNGCPYIFWYTILLLYMFVYHIFITSPLWLAVGPQSL